MAFISTTRKLGHVSSVSLTSVDVTGCIGRMAEPMMCLKGGDGTPPFLGLRRELRPGRWIAEIHGRISQPDDPEVACNHNEHFAIGDQPGALVKVSRFHGLTGMMTTTSRLSRRPSVGGLLSSSNVKEGLSSCGRKGTKENGA